MSINQSDQILLKSYLSGDEAAFEILIKKHKDKVFAFILSKINWGFSLKRDIFNQLYRVIK